MARLFDAFADSQRDVRDHRAPLPARGRVHLSRHCAARHVGPERVPARRGPDASLALEPARARHRRRHRGVARSEREGARRVLARTPASTRVRALEHEDDLPEIALLVDWAWPRLSVAARRALARARARRRRSRRCGVAGEARTGQAARAGARRARALAPRAGAGARAATRCTRWFATPSRAARSPTPTASSSTT